MSTDHPIHPATVHWPIAFLSLSYGLDVLYGVTALVNLPVVSSLANTLLTTASLTVPDVTRASHYMNALGILTGIPSVMSGGQQLVKMIGNGGLYEADNKTIRSKVKMTLAHAALNDIILITSTYNWYTRRDVKGMAPTELSVLISSVALPILMFSANLGGTLTYNYGVGLNIGSKNKKQ